MLNVRKLLQKTRPKTLRHPLPVRLFHWTHTVSTLLLLYSGLHIAYPRAIPLLNMRRARHLHFITQIVFVTSLIGRVGYTIVTRDYKKILPERKDLSALPGFLRYELFLTAREPSFPKYNPLQKIYFTAWLPLFLLQAVTGFALYAPRRLGILEAAFGGLRRTRTLHHLFAVVQGTTALAHIYFTATAGVEKLKSMITGYKALGKK